MRRPLAEGRKQREASAQALSGALAWSAGCATQGRWSHHHTQGKTLRTLHRDRRGCLQSGDGEPLTSVGDGEPRMSVAHDFRTAAPRPGGQCACSTRLGVCNTW